MDKNTDDALPRTRRGLRDLRLRNRLVLLVLLPLIAAVALGAARVVTENDAITAEGNLAGQVQVALTVSKLVHGVQDERDLIARYLTNGQRTEDMTSLAAAESNTTAQVQAFEAARKQYAGSISALAPSAQALAVQADARLGDLTVLRSSVVSLGDSRPVFQAYTTIIGSLLNFSDQLATSTTDHDLGNLVNSLSLVEQSGEQTSQERGYLVSILGGGGQARVQQEALIQAQAKYTSATTSLTAQAAPATANLFQSTVGGQSTGTADSLVQQVIDAALDNRPASTIGADPVGAFNAATAKVTQVRQVENQVAAQALDRTSFLQSAARTRLYVNAGIVILTLLLAFAATATIARSIVEPLRVLRTSAYQIATDGLPSVIRRLRDATDVDAAAGTRVEPIAVRSRDEIGAVARAFDEVHDAAVRLATEQALLRGNVNSMFKNLSRRSQGLVERQLLLIDGLENSEKDPGQLAQLFKLDHLATRMRRNNENLLVLAGEETARRWTEAVQLVDVARAAAAEVEQYERIMFGEIPRTRIVGKAAPDVAHLVAELLENATTYSSPQTKVWVAARGADDGGVILHIEDVGIGMTAADLRRSNERLANPPLVDVGVSRQMGLFVVGRLAARYGISVTLSESPAGGVTASIHLPVTLVDLGAMAARRPGDSGAQPRVTVPGMARDGFTSGGLLDQGRGAAPDDWQAGDFGRTKRLGEPPMPPPPDASAGAGFREPPMNGAGRSGANPVLPGQFATPLFPGPAAPDGYGADPRQPDSLRSNAAVYVDGVPSSPITDPTWFEPKQAAPDGGEPQPAQRQEGGRTQIPPPRQDPLPTRGPRPAQGSSSAQGSHPVQNPQPTQGLRQTQGLQQTQGPQQTQGSEVRQAARGDAAMTDTNERLPIFEAVESEWFRRRGTRPPHSGWSPRSVQPWDATRAASGAAQAASNVQQVQAGPGMSGPGSQSPNAGRFRPPAAPAPRMTESEPAARTWSSPGDDAWKAAAALANPVRDGTTTSGLPRRVPKANLVPGKAGANGAAKVTPPPGLSSTAEAVRRRLSTFRRNSQQLSGETEQS
ncbi:nitrate- and nitrite sensing domain-containing protein [Actinocrinis sp.]|uniref:sensor histidine kinase n=1 Tax=Actinocrinis sp. TaxID=1920516 RepID=UPI002C25AC92|nr:nitrate- and nitrite sensing domain-containing protein [Actinocrinis sp.]HXR70390.1 nitrate- and nitrite sensing domain-containing protein [Actinocrinis sp.]